MKKRITEKRAKALAVKRGLVRPPAAAGHLLGCDFSLDELDVRFGLIPSRLDLFGAPRTHLDGRRSNGISHHRLMVYSFSSGDTDEGLLRPYMSDPPR